MHGIILLLSSTVAPALALEPAPVSTASWTAVASSSTVMLSTAALLPGSRIVSYYGNPLSKRMGILGELPPEEMMQHLQQEVTLWEQADASSTVRPALELVAAVASDQPGEDKLYRSRMSFSLIDKVLGWSRKRGWLTILDVQPGHSKIQAEIERLMPYLEQPDVHLALDPEFQMPKRYKPGDRIGRADAEDVNVAVIELAKLVERKNLPPKVLIVHRFTDAMLRRYEKIRLDPRVQIVIVMDGFGGPASKKKIYRHVITREPVQYAGIKLFYKNDQPLMSRRRILELDPVPRVIIYQ